MTLALTQSEALLFLPFVAPICLWVVYSDLSLMKITNKTNIVLATVFILLGLFVLTPEEYGWRLVQLAIVLVIGIVANAIGLMGGGDSKFLASAAPFVAPGDVAEILMLLAAISVVALLTHRLAKASSLRKLAPEWVSWHREGKFPMGLALGPTLIAYLILGCLIGS